MAGEYIIDFTDPVNGTFTINAIETEGPNSVNLVPLVSADNVAELFTVSADFTSRFLPGFAFDVINSLAGNNGSYTTASSVYQGASAIFNINAFSLKFTIAGADYTTIFTSGRIFKISGSIAPVSNDGYWITASSLFFLGNTEITVENVVPTGYRSGSTIDDSEGVPTGNIITNLTAIVVDPTSYSILGADVNSDSFVVASDVSSVFAVGRQFVVAGTPSNNGTYVTVSSTFEPTYSINAVIVGAGGTWTVSGNHEGEFVVGGSITVAGNTGGGNGVYTIASVINAGANTDITVTGIIPALSSADGTLTNNGITLIYTSPIVATQTTVGTLSTNNPLYSIGIPDGQIEYTLTGNTSLTLPGRGALNYGENVVEDLVHSLEHFSAAVPPPAPIQGQLWYDNATPAPFIFGSTNYSIIAVNAGTGVWTISGNHAGSFLFNDRIAVYNDLGLTSVNGIVGGTVTYTVFSAANVGPNTDITINSTVFNPIDATAIAGTATGNGLLYNMTNWHQLALLSDVQNLDWKESVLVTTTAPLTTPYTYNNGASGVGATITATVNGNINAEASIETPASPLVAGDRILIKNQTFENGIYVVTQVGSGGSPYILTRSVDADSDTNITPGLATVVEEGVTYADTSFVLITNDPIVIGTTPLIFTVYPAIAQPLNQIVYGTGASITSEADFTWNPATDTMMVGGVGDLGTITNGDGGTIEFDSGIVRLTGDNGDFIEIGASINITGVAGALGSTVTITSGNATLAGTGGNAILTAGSGGDTGIAGTTTISGGAGGATSGDGGLVTIQGGIPTDGAGGAVTIAGRDAAGVGDYTGGAVNITSGNSTGTTDGSNVNVTAGDATGSDGNGGTVVLQGGLGFDEGIGGGVTLIAGDGGSAGLGSIGGSINLTGGNGGAVDGAGGNIALTSGNAVGTSLGGYVHVTGGNGDTTGAGGDISLTGGAGGVVSGDGGQINLVGGDATNLGAGGGVQLESGISTGLNQNGGNITMNSGAPTGTGTAGRFTMTSSGGGYFCERSGDFSVTGDAQTCHYVLRTQTTTAALTEMFLDGTSGTRQMVLANDSTWHFEVKIIARRTDANDEGFAIKIEGAIDRNASAATTALIGTTTDTTLAQDIAAATWTAIVNADAVNGVLRIQVTGEVGKTINWVAFVRTVEVTG